MLDLVPLVILNAAVGLLIVGLSWRLSGLYENGSYMRYWALYWAAATSSIVLGVLVRPGSAQAEVQPASYRYLPLLLLLALRAALMAMAAASLFENRFPRAARWTGVSVFAAAVAATAVARTFVNPSQPALQSAPAFMMSAAAAFVFAFAYYRRSAGREKVDLFSTCVIAAYGAHLTLFGLSAFGVALYPALETSISTSMTISVVLGCLIALALGFDALRQAETARRRAEMLWTAAQEGMIVVSRAGVVLQANPAYGRIFDSPPASVLDAEVWVVFSDDEKPRVAAMVLAELGGNASGTTQLVHARLRNGREAWLEYSFSPLPARDAFLIVVRDATERIAAQQSYAMIVSRTPIGMHFYGFDRERGLILTGANAAADSILGIDHQQMVGKSIEEAFPSLAGTEIPAAYRAVLETGTPFRRDEVTYADDRITGAYEVLCFQLNANSIAVMFDDITERKRADDALRSSEARYRLITDHSTDMISVHEPDGAYVFASPVCRSLFGYEPEDLIGHSAYEFFHPEDVAAIRRSHDAVNSSGSARSVAYRFRRADGTWVWVETFSRSVGDNADGSQGRIIAVTRDVTERRNLEEQFQRAQRLDSIGRLAGGVAHDFNNLLTVVNGNAALIESDGSSSPRSRELAAAIRGAGERAASLTRHLLAFGRRQRLDPVILDLNHAVLDFRPILHELAGPEIEVSLDLESSPTYILADPIQINQVLLNLAINARDAIEKSGSITITTRKSAIQPHELIHPELPAGSYIRLLFSDTGRGMTAGVREKIFEPFFTTKEIGKGTGLGLSTVFGIVKQSNGHIQVRSEPGEGAEFEIFFPFVSESLAGTGAVRKPDPPAILIVEAQPDMAKYIRTVLEMDSYRILEARDELSALHAPGEAAAPAAVIIGDIGPMKGSSASLLPRIRERYPGIRIIVLSAEGQPMALRDPLVSFVSKPFTPEALLAEVASRLK